jgi:hypothetical protein
MFQDHQIGYLPETRYDLPRWQGFARFENYIVPILEMITNQLPVKPDIA